LYPPPPGRWSPGCNSLTEQHASPRASRTRRRGDCSRSGRRRLRRHRSIVGGGSCGRRNCSRTSPNVAPRAGADQRLRMTETCGTAPPP
jgi:hypothetical protein